MLKGPAYIVFYSKSCTVRLALAVLAGLVNETRQFFICGQPSLSFFAEWPKQAKEIV